MKDRKLTTRAWLMSKTFHSANRYIQKFDDIAFMIV